MRTGIRVAGALALTCLVTHGGCGRGSEPTVAEEAAAAAARGVDRAREERTLNRFEQLRLALDRYAMDHGGYPEGHSLVSIGSQLTPLYLPRLDTEDAWGNTMSYSSDGRSYTITSAGDDGIVGSADDITMQDGAVSAGS